MYVACYHALAYHRVPYLHGHILASTELFELFMVVTHDVVCGASFHEVDDIVLAESFFHGDDSLQYDEQSLLTVALHFRV